VDNVPIRLEERPTGNSAAAGIRKLQKAAAEGNEEAIRELAETEAEDWQGPAYQTCKNAARLPNL
jgi:hypothetical protein